MDSNLEGKTAPITGASSGIGEATARLLAATGCDTVLAARREGRLNNLAKAFGDHALPIPADVTDAAVCELLVEKAVERFGALDVQVNNAGLGINGSVVEGDPENWRTMFGAKVTPLRGLTQLIKERERWSSLDHRWSWPRNGRAKPRPKPTCRASRRP